MSMIRDEHDTCFQSRKTTRHSYTTTKPLPHLPPHHHNALDAPSFTTTHPPTHLVLLLLPRRTRRLGRALMLDDGIRNVCDEVRQIRARELDLQNR